MTSLNPAFTVGDQISEAILRHRKVTPAEARTQAIDMLRRVQIPSPERRALDYPHQLSGGMRQRVMIAMALACNPQLLIADEPTTALDVTIQAQILDLMRTLREQTGTAIILITHDPASWLNSPMTSPSCTRPRRRAKVADLFAHRSIRTPSVCSVRSRASMSSRTGSLRSKARYPIPSHRWADAGFTRAVRLSSSGAAAKSPRSPTSAAGTWLRAGACPWPPMRVPPREVLDRNRAAARRQPGQALSGAAGIVRAAIRRRARG